MLRLPLTLAAAVRLAVCATASGAREVIQTNWTIVSATGTTHHVVDGSVGAGAATWTFKADVLAKWRKTAKLTGNRTASFNFTSMARYVPGRTGGAAQPDS
jgi:hypothetical protein